MPASKIIVQELISAGRVLFEMQLVDSHSGNLSVRLERGCWATRSGSRLGFLSVEDILAFADPEDPPARVTSEWIVHREIFRRTRCGAIVHCHPPHANALAFNRTEIEPIDTEAAMLTGTIPVLAPANPVASPEAAEATAGALAAGARAVLLRRHGLFALADTLDMALARASAVDYAARLILLSGQ